MPGATGQAGSQTIAFLLPNKDIKIVAAGTIPGADNVFDNFPGITGKQPVKWVDFIEKHKSELDY